MSNTDDLNSDKNKVKDETTITNTKKNSENTNNPTPHINAYNPYQYGIPMSYGYYGYQPNYVMFNQQAPNQYMWPPGYPYYNYYGNINHVRPMHNYTPFIPQINNNVRSQNIPTIPKNPMDSLNNEALKCESTVGSKTFSINTSFKPNNSNINITKTNNNIYNTNIKNNVKVLSEISTSGKTDNSNTVLKTNKNNHTNQNESSSMNDKYTSLPIEMKGYVNRCFASCKNSKQKDLMEDHLRDVIKNAITTRRLHLVNWDKRPLPKFGDDIKCNLEEINYSSESSSVVNSPPIQNEIIQPNNYVNRKKKKKQDYKNRSSMMMIKENTINKKVKEKFVLEMDENDLRNRISRRQNRFKKQESHKQLNPLNTINSNSFEMITTNCDSLYNQTTITSNSKPVVGYSEEIEKPYLRLTSAPNPATVRPQPILEKSLEFITKKYKKDLDYHYVCEQFKSIRQDLTIQGIRNDFVVKVYEKHARIALDENDLSEFNQCQNVLRDLYADGFNGSQFEFLGYRFFYYIYTNSTLDISNIIKEIFFYHTTTINNNNNENDNRVHHLVKFYVSWQLKDYRTFFKIYHKYFKYKKFMKIISYFLDRERLISLKVMTKSYFPNISLNKIIHNLGFNDREEAINWLSTNYNLHPENDCITNDDSLVLFNCKNINKVLSQKGVL